MSSRIIPDNNKNPLDFTKLPPIPNAKRKDYYEDEIKSKRHTCTDVICLILFLVFVCAQIALSVLIYTYGSNPKNVLLPHDSNGQLCTGSTPYLFFFNLADCLNTNSLLKECPTTKLCVSQCPQENLFYIIPSHRSILFQNYCNQAYLSMYFSGNIPAASTIDQATYSTLINRNICPIYTLTSEPLFLRCFPSFLKQAESTVQNVLATDLLTNKTYQISDQNQQITTSLINNAAKSLSNLIDLSGIGILTFSIERIRGFINAYHNFENNHFK